MDADTALRMLGKYSKWQMKTYLIYAIGFGIPFAWMLMAIVYIGDTPNFRCAIPENATLNETIPLECDSSDNCKYSQCTMFKNFSVDNSTTECQYGYWYDPASGYESTLVTEFDLVCGKNWLVELSMTANAVGAMFGGLIFTQLSDTFGRKKIFLLCITTNSAIAFTQAFSVNMLMYTVLAFLDGVLQQGLLGTAGVLAIEIFPEEQRTFAGSVIEFFWAFGYMTMVPIAYFIRNWRYLQVAITGPLLFTFIFIWFTSESIPWLVANNKKKEAEDILRKAAKFNGIDYPPHVFTHMTEQELDDINTTSSEEKNTSVTERRNNTESVNSLPKNIPSYKIWDIFLNRKMFLYSCVLWYLWFVNNLGYYAMSLTVTYLPGDRYINTLLYAVMEIPAYALIWIALYYFGRRFPISLFHILGGIVLICTIIQTFDTENNLSALIIVLSVVGKTCFTASFSGVYLFGTELYPTNLRSTGAGLSQSFGKIGILIAPYFRVLARHAAFMPSVIIGVSSLFAGIIVLCLPETRYEPLPDTIEQVEAFKRKLDKKRGHV